MLLIGPLTEYYLSRTWRTPKSFVGAWWEHIADGEVLSMTGPMWFCAALLIFCCFYAVVRWLTANAATQLGRAMSLTNRSVVLLAACLALTTYLAKALLPCGATLYNMHLADFPSYIIVFALGICAYRQGWLGRLQYQFGLRWGGLGLGVGVLLWPALIVFGGAMKGSMAAFGCGWHWQNLGMSIWAAIICVGVSLGVLAFFREKFNAQTRLTQCMSANAFAVYLFHPPILIALALALSRFNAPALAKFVLLTGLGVIANFIAAEYLFRRVPVLNRVL